MTNQDKNWILFWIYVIITASSIIYLTDQI